MFWRLQRHISVVFLTHIWHYKWPLQVIVIIKPSVCLNDKILVLFGSTMVSWMFQQGSDHVPKEWLFMYILVLCLVPFVQKISRKSVTRPSVIRFKNPFCRGNWSIICGMFSSTISCRLFVKCTDAWRNFWRGWCRNWASSSFVFHAWHVMLCSSICFVVMSMDREAKCQLHIIHVDVHVHDHGLNAFTILHLVVRTWSNAAA